MSQAMSNLHSSLTSLYLSPFSWAYSGHVRDDAIRVFRGQVHLQTGPQVSKKGSHPGWYKYVHSKKETLELLHTIETQEDGTLGKESHTTE